jgi:mono/diheme cytochrome c family protein
MRLLAAAALFGLCATSSVLVTARQEPSGKAAYDRSCAACHGLEGRGEAAPGLVPMTRELAEVLAIVREGYGEMPPIGRSTASDEDVSRIVAYLRSMK